MCCVYTVLHAVIYSTVWQLKADMQHLSNSHTLLSWVVHRIALFLRGLCKSFIVCAVQADTPWSTDRCVAVARALHCLAQLQAAQKSDPAVQQVSFTSDRHWLDQLDDDLVALSAWWWSGLQGLHASRIKMLTCNDSDYARELARNAICSLSGSNKANTDQLKATSTSFHSSSGNIVCCAPHA